MSVDGKIVQIYKEHNQGQMWVNTFDGHDYCAVFVEMTGETKVALGDSLWWQSGKVYWTSKDPNLSNYNKEVTLKKIGNSGVSHPLGKEYEVRHDFYPAFKKSKERIKELEAALKDAVEMAEKVLDWEPEGEETVRGFLEKHKDILDGLGGREDSGE